MDIEKGKTFKYLREIRPVTETAKENLKNFNAIKKSILNALRENDMTVDQLTQELNMPKHEVFYYLMTLIKYGFAEKGAIDDMDEYFSYKLKK
jgi:predicted transcriptional regulator